MRCATAAMALAGAFAGVAAPAAGAATLRADYQFDGSYASSVGAPADVREAFGVAGQDTFVSETVDGVARMVLAFPADNGLELQPASSAVPADRYTIVLLARLQDVSGYRRFIDFKHGTSDNGAYDLNGALNFYPRATGPAATIQAGAYHQVAYSRSATGLISGYVDGVLQFTVDDSAQQDGVIDAVDMLRFFRDNDTPPPNGEESAGAVARIRLYDDALSDAQVAALDRLPTDDPCANPGAVVGTAGNDTLNGTAGPDVICGLGGNDQIKGLGGDDVLIGGDGVDVIDGGADNDTLLGGAGDDALVGGTGVDTLRGGDGNDRLDGGLGADVLAGDAGADLADYVLRSVPVTASIDDGPNDGAAGEGDDIQGVERLRGGSAGDTLTGDANANILYGGPGSDQLTGNAGNDIFYGAAGNDTINALDGTTFVDTLNCGADNDFTSTDPRDRKNADCEL